MIEELELVTELACGDVIIGTGGTVTGIRVTEKTYKVFLSNGWWAVDSSYFKYCEDKKEV